MAETPVRCEWCGGPSAGIEVGEVVRGGGRFLDPFHKREPRYRVCSENCRADAAGYYAAFRREGARWAWIIVGIFVAGFAVAIPFGYPVFRWSVSLAIVLGGACLWSHPYANSFRCDRAGNLRTPLKHSRRDGRYLGALFVVLGIIFAVVNTQMPGQLLSH